MGINKTEWKFTMPDTDGDGGATYWEEGLVHTTRRGDKVRSKSEVIIADLLYSKDIEYEYEQRLDGLNDDGYRYPDFTIRHRETGHIIYWEHLGMWYVPAYREKWWCKERWYRDQDILSWKEGGGPNGTLFVTGDDQQGGIDSAAIERQFDILLGRMVM